MPKRIRLYSICLAILLSPMLYRSICSVTSDSFYPSTLSVSIMLIPVLLTYRLKNFINVLFMGVWIAWFFIGVLNIVSSYNSNQSYYMKVSEGCVVYALFTAMLAAGVYAGEKYSLPKIRILKTIQPISPADGPFVSLLLLFPVAWLMSLYGSLGFLPVLKGVDITDTMYGMSYGSLYGYGIINAVSVLFAYEKYLNQTKRSGKVKWLAYIVVVLLISSVDSKRYILLIALLGMFTYSKLRNRSLTLDLSTLKYGAIGVVLYIALLGLRQGNMDVSAYGQYFQTLAIGVEYRDFIRTFNDYQPGMIPHYNFENSLVGAFFNEGLISLFGANKKELTMQGSAYTWMAIFDSTLGIRTGLISELYFAYNLVGGLAAVFLFGLLINYTAVWMLRAKTVFSLVLFCLGFALLFMSVMGQSTATAGQLCVLLYAYFAYRIYKLLVPAKATRTPTVLDEPEQIEVQVADQPQANGLRYHPGIQPHPLHHRLS